MTSTAFNRAFFGYKARNKVLLRNKFLTYDGPTVFAVVVYI